MSNKVAEELWPVIKRGKCIAWIGSGLSKGVYPGWKETVNELCDACRVQSLKSEEQSVADRLIDKAEECKLANLEEYKNTLANLFGRQPVYNRFAFDYLVNLRFLKGIVTTNFDPLLSLTAATHGNNDIYSYPNLPVSKIGENPCPIFYIHGLARHGYTPNGNNLILARSDFNLAYNGIVRSFLDQLLTYYDLLFLGCRLTEPAIHDAFQRVHDIHMQIKSANSEVPLPQRFILHPTSQRIDLASSTDVDLEEEKKPDEEKRFNEMGIEVIRYEPRDVKVHSEVEEILESLCNLAKRNVSQVSKFGLGEELPS